MHLTTTQASHGSSFSNGVAAYGMPVATDAVDDRKSRSTQISLRLFQHSLFLMRQFKEKKWGSRELFNFELTGSEEGNHQYTETIDNFVGRNNYLHGLYQGLSQDEDLEKNRELITYGQTTLIISGTGTGGNDYYHSPSHIDINDILSSSLVRDQLILVESSQSQDAIALSFTGSFNIEANCRVTPKTDRVAGLGTTTNQATLLRSTVGW